jgi:hypothetical protein
MIVCDPCSKGSQHPLRAARRIYVHKLNDSGQEGFSVATIDLCETHYQEVIAPLETAKNG